MKMCCNSVLVVFIFKCRLNGLSMFAVNFFMELYDDMSDLYNILFEKVIILFFLLLIFFPYTVYSFMAFIERQIFLRTSVRY